LASDSFVETEMGDENEDKDEDEEDERESDMEGGRAGP
jgi:hypothetical protein